MNFRVGQKVVCIRANGVDPLGIIASLVLGATYTIRGIECEYRPDGAGLWLEELRNPIWQWHGTRPSEASFCASRFRPVVERPTDISIFTRMLDPVREPETVGVDHVQSL
jgi:hypothetical protein